MKKFFFRSLIVAGLIMFCISIQPAYAEEPPGLPWAPGVEIVRVGQDGPNTIIVLRHSNWNNESIFFTINSIGAKEMLATALTALSSDRPVNVRYSINPNVIYRLRLDN